jgi:hypothetical protein
MGSGCLRVAEWVAKGVTILGRTLRRLMSFRGMVSCFCLDLWWGFGAIRGGEGRRVGAENREAVLLSGLWFGQQQLEELP